MSLSENLNRSQLTIGIIAGGQLGKMLIQKASEWSLQTSVLDPDESCPARDIASSYTKGSYLDFDTVYNFGKKVDILTFELENINIEALKKLQKEGVYIAPDPHILECIQDKEKQKKWYGEHDIPTSPFESFESREDIIKAIEEKKLSFPFVQKLCKGGFDGRGVSVIHSIEDIPLLLEGGSIVEEKITIEKEIAVLVARNKRGEVRCFPATEMTFDKKANLVEHLLCPANIPEEREKEAEEIAERIATNIHLEGILAVEFFITDTQEVLVNESAPRPHNSGHHTIESIVTSQFEQHLRAILNLPLGNTDIISPAVMLNILGEEGYSGSVLYSGFEEILKEDRAYIHLYGKKITKPFRKMGHITLLGNTSEDALQKAERIKHSFSVRS